MIRSLRRRWHAWRREAALADALFYLRELKLLPANSAVPQPIRDEWRRLGKAAFARALHHATRVSALRDVTGGAR